MFSLFDGEELLPSYNFMVTIGQGIFGFSKMSNLSSQIEYETVQEGGNNDYPLLFPKQKTSPDTLVLEKGVRVRSSDQAFNALLEGMRVEQVTILLIGEDKQPEKEFFIQHGLIVKRTFSDLDAAQNGLLIETLEIAHSGLEEIPLL